MEKNMLPVVISSTFPTPEENTPAPRAIVLTPKRSLQADTLRVLAGLSGGAAGSEINDFLSGKGLLVESTRAALTRGKTTAVVDLAAMLSDQFKLAPATAQVIAALLVKLFPSVGKVAAAAAPKKKKTKPKAESSPAAKKRKKKTAAKEKPAAKKKAAAKKTRKEPKTSKKVK